MSHAFEHACRRCARNFSPPINLEVFSVLTAVCPYCGFNHGYDNREGKILSLVEQKYGAMRSEKRFEEYSPALTKERYSAPQPRSFFAPPPVETSTEAFHAPQPAAITPPEPPRVEPVQPEEAKFFPEVPPEYPYEKYEAPEVVESTAVVKEPHEPWRALPQKLIHTGRDFIGHIGWKRMIFAAGAATLAFIGTLLVLQAIPVSSEEARQAIASLKARQADVVLDRNGHELNKLGVSQSDKAELSEFHKWQLDALLFSEDRKFYEHHGVQYSSIFRAIINNLSRFRYAQGASTITQQLARIILQNRKKSIFRKLAEVRLARALEVVLSKQKILDLYVNNVYLGHGNYSFASAAKFYYNKRIRDLTPNEFLSIVALIPSPEKFSPLKNNRRLVGRMQNLYEGMTAAGILNVSPEAWQKGMESVTEQSGRFSSETAFGEKSRSGLWPAQFARDFLMQRKILFAENQNSARVYTTIDGELQQKAEELVQKHLERGRRNFRGVVKSDDSDEIRLRNKLRRAAYDSGLMLELAGLGVAREAEPQLQAALIALSPRTGEVLAMVGGDSFESNNQLNRTVQMRRQTGSAIKPFIYAKAASLHLIHPASIIDDTPYVVGSGSRVWAPENINGGFMGPMPAREALAKSRNIPAIRVGRLVGRDGVTELFSEFFFQSENALAERFSYDETVAIGTISLSPLEMARAFSVFANNGYLNDPILITRVEAHEKVIDVRKTHADQLGLTAAPKERILTAAETALMVSMLKSSGKNSGSGLSGVIGKTGTSSESRDLWFVGGGKEVIVAVWFGFDDMRYSIPGATGSALASKLAGDFIGKDFTPVDFKMQPGMVRLRVCPLSGKIASEGCSHARSEIFLSGVMPEGECLHGSGGASSESEFMAVMGESQFR